MTERKPGDDRWIAGVLKAEADRHEPDHERIRRRIRNREAETDVSGDSSGLWGQRFRPSADEPLQRPSRLLPAAAAAVVVLTAGAITALHGSDHSSGASPPSRVMVTDGTIRDPTTPSGAPTSEPTSAIASPSPTSAPTSPAAASSRSQGAESSAPTTPAKAATSTGASRQRKPDVVVTATVAKAGHAVVLPGSARDWIAAASRSATETVRRQHGDQLISGPHVYGNPTSATATGPFRLAWTDGMPETSDSGSRIWRTVTGPAGGPETGYKITVPVESRTSKLVLYVGAQGADGQLQVELSDRSEVSRTTLKAGPGGTGYVVRILFQSKSPKALLTAKLLGGSGGAISFAAAALH
jgi:hypothetical protein